jgi:MFS family permease
VSRLPASAAGARAGIIDVLRQPDYRRLWASGFFVNVARWMDLVTLGWLALQLTGSPFMVALAAFARSAPMMVLGPFGGIVADRVPRGRILIATQAIGVVTALALAAIFATRAGGYGPLVALEIVFGALWALDFPARRTALYTILGAQRVAQAVSLETVSMQLAKMIGPLAAGVCLARMGPSVCFALMAVVYGIGLGVSLGLHGRLGGTRRGPSVSVVASLRAGLHAAWTHRTVRVVLLATIAMNTLFFTYQPMLPVFARDVLDVGPTALGALLAADGCGALLGALAIASRHGFLAHRTLFAASIVAGPVLLIPLSGLPWLPACLALMVVLGVAESGFAAMQSTLVLLSAPEHLRGGAMGILSACIGTQPIGTLLIGVLTASIGVSLAFTVNAVVSLLVLVPLAAMLVRRP